MKNKKLKFIYQNIQKIFNGEAIYEDTNINVQTPLIWAHHIKATF